MTISICMIVKNEEQVLKRCLDSCADLADEIIIVDTGSTDGTKKIAAEYTDKIFDFEWIGDFSAARNYAFSLCSMDYIYSVDADEVLDEENRERFRILKRELLPEIEIVQMKYGNQLENGTVYNFDEEYRPKLFKRLRTFTWIEPVHETVRLDPVVYDSDIVIRHMPVSVHSSRDIEIFKNRLSKEGELSERLWEMFAKELFISGSDEDIIGCEPYFRAFEEKPMTVDLHKVICSVLCKAARIKNDTDSFFKYSVKLLAGSEGCSEVCTEMGHWYENKQDYQEALIWYYNAVNETAPIISIRSGGTEPLDRMIEIYDLLGNTEEADNYRRIRDGLGK